MDNNQDKNMYQYPTPQSGEALGAPLVVESTELTEEQTRQKFAEIEREYVRDTFNQMTQDLEMSISGFEIRQQPVVEIMSVDPIASELLQIGNELTDLRQEQVNSNEELVAARHWYHHLFATLLGRKY